MSNLYETFKDSLVGDLDASEQKELAKFASALTSARGTDQQEVLIEEAMSGMIDPEDFVKVAHLVAIVTSHEKTAKMSTTDKVMAGTAIAGALTGLAPLAIQAVRAIRGSHAQNKSLQHAMQQHPMLGEPANAMQTRQNFQVLRTFAPDVAGSAPVAANALVRMHRMGPAAADINTVKEMAETQKQIADKYRNEGAAFVSAGQGIRDVGSVYRSLQQDSVKRVEDAAKDREAGNAAKREQLYAKSVMRNYDILSTSQTPTPIAQRIGKAEEMAQSTQRLRDMKMASKGLMQLPSRPAKKKS